mmetsp:Transcript_5597/g.11820  ORF Transcript_5597/g.11820 Transcript_5597/m.11820 type:complete len:506 (-) Transcript_5597:125-1642(-)
MHAMKHCWLHKLLMLYLLGCVGSNAFAIGGSKKGATHLAGNISRGGGGGRRAISRIIHLYNGSDNSSSSSSTALKQTSSYNEHPQHTPLIYKGGHICVRLARKSDVPQIQNCNLATLPENYNANFYVNHMRQWPDLALVAEHIPEGYDLQRDMESHGSAVEEEERITPLREYITKKRRRGDGSNQPPRKEIVGYILGKVEERPVNPIRQIFPQSRVPPLYDEEDTLLQYMDGANMNGARVFRQANQNQQQQQQQRRRTETLGHVTSIAVHSHARRLGIASSLLDQLHYHLGQCYNAKSVGLHVRISNQAAVKLYCERLGYDVADIIPFYYGDGEDAYFMKKDLLFVGDDNGDDGYDDDVVVDERRRLSQSSSFESRDEWINRDARSGGSFFDNRSSMRDSLSPEERAWINSGGGNNNNNNSSSQQRGSIGGHFKRSFQTFLNGGDPSPTPPPQGSRSWDNRPVWETGPEYLRLPRYTEIRKSAPGERIEDETARASMEYEQRVAS